MNVTKPAGRISNHSTRTSRMADYRFCWWLASLNHLFSNPVKYRAPAWWSTRQPLVS